MKPSISRMLGPWSFQALKLLPSQNEFQGTITIVTFARKLKMTMDIARRHLQQTKTQKMPKIETGCEI